MSDPMKPVPPERKVMGGREMAAFMVGAGLFLALTCVGIAAIVLAARWAL